MLGINGLACEREPLSPLAIRIQRVWGESISGNGGVHTVGERGRGLAHTGELRYHTQVGSSGTVPSGVQRTPIGWSVTARLLCS